LTQQWVNLTTSNYGVILWATNEDTDGMNLFFRSSEYTTDPTMQPKLEIIWSQLPRTVYFLKDHLGSIRASVQDTSTAPVVGYDDYDPWGYILAGRSSISSGWSSQAGIIKNKFTGKEWDDEFGVNWNYFGARYYDPLTGRWMVVDPLAQKYPSLSPYSYAANNPIIIYDPDGRVLKYIGSKTEISLLKSYVARIGMTEAGKFVVNYLDKEVKQDIVIKFGKITAKEEGRGVLGLTVSKITVQLDEKGDVEKASFKGATITLDKGKKEFEPIGVTSHELRHTQQQADDPTYWAKKSKEEKGKPHGDRQAEEDATWFARIVKQQLKEKESKKDERKDEKKEK